MAQPLRFLIEESIVFVTTRLKNQRFRLSDEEKRIIQETLIEASDHEEIVLYAYVIMPDHFHALLKPNGNELSKTMQLLKGRSSRRINKGILWQKGFHDFMIVSEKKFEEKFNYIHKNPVLKGLAENPESYPFSSAEKYIKECGECLYLS
jgi:putative transposase